MLLIRIILWVILAILGVMGLGFAMLNSGSVPVSYHYGTWDLELAWIVGISISIGLFVGLLVSFSYVLRMKRQLMKLRRENRKALTKQEKIRSVPIRASA